MSSGINQNILNFLRRRYEISKIEIAGTEVIQLYFNNGEVIINSLQNRKQMELNGENIYLIYGKNLNLYVFTIA